MRVGVFGGLGFLGANLVEALEGHEVYVYHRPGAHSAKADLARAVARHAALVEYRDPAEALRSTRPDAVVNLVGEFFGDRETLWGANVEFVRSLCAAIREAGIGYLLHVSAATVVGPTSHHIVEEESHLQGVAPATPFDESKAEGERIVASCGVDWAIARPVLMYGPYNDHPEWVALVRMVRRGVVPVVGARLSAVEAREAAAVIARALGRVRNDYFFVTECSDYGLADFVDAVAGALGRRPVKVTVPLWAARMLAPRPLRGHLKFLNKRFSCEKMARLTGYVPRRRLDEGVGEMVRWILRRWRG